MVAEADAAGEVDGTVSVDSTINRAHQHAATAGRIEEPAGPWSVRRTGAEANHMNLPAEPTDHAMGHSRGGLSTKIHQLVDGRGRPPVIAVTPSQAGDSPILEPLS